MGADHLPRATDAPLIKCTESIALARRALAHLQNKTTDQAPSMMEQAVDAYIDAQRYQREVANIFKQLPLSVELPTPRSYRALTVLDVPVLLSRGEDGVARAFVNVCRHRGAQICPHGSGTAQRFVCPYHAWQFDLQGRLTGLYGASTFGEVDPASRSLTPLVCSERAGLLWVVLTPGIAFDIDDWLGDFAGQLDTLNLNRWHLHEQRDLAGPGWKVAWDGYLEAYHHNTVHTGTVGQYTVGNLLVHDTYGPHQRLVFGKFCCQFVRCVGHGTSPCVISPC